MIPDSLASCPIPRVHRAMSDSEDSYAGYNDFADLTEEDLLALGTPDPSTLASTSKLPELRDQHGIGASSVAEEVKVLCAAVVLKVLETRLLQKWRYGSVPRRCDNQPNQP